MSFFYSFFLNILSRALFALLFSLLFLVFSCFDTWGVAAVDSPLTGLGSVDAARPGGVAGGVVPCGVAGAVAHDGVDITKVSAAVIRTCLYVACGHEGGGQVAG